ncbi:class V lanthionine synthetase subunit LxmK [Streptomyces sp. NPDC127098]|uniref:class V lanthionine synthetase subunit LxmK n=1 Tax=Streptomyces sp. NPDC127098 TaxID=3347137 RepID=UPI003649F6DC
MERKKVAPLPVDQVPQLNEFLGRLDLGRLADHGTSAHPGRNDNWVGTTSAGFAIFVKRLVGEPADVAARMRRSRSFHALVERVGTHELRAPRLLGADEATGLEVFALLDGASSGAELAADDVFGDTLAHRAGRLVGLLHSSPTEGVVPELDRSRLRFPSPELNTALPLDLFVSLTGAELHLWRIVHQDPQLTEALSGLRDRERAAPLRPTHCDLRLDQFLDTGDGLFLTDGEEFRLADPARDVGSFAGEWLHQAIAWLTRREAHREADDRFGAPSHEEIVARGVRRLNRLRPRVRAFLAGYRSACPDTDPEFTTRAAAVAGWHLIDRALATAGQSARLSAISRATMGIGRNVLLSPETYAETLGLGPVESLEAA